MVRILFFFGLSIALLDNFIVLGNWPVLLYDLRIREIELGRNDLNFAHYFWRSLKDLTFIFRGRLFFNYIELFSFNHSLI